MKNDQTVLVIQNLSNLLLIKELEVSNLNLKIVTLNERISWLESQFYPELDEPTLPNLTKRSPVGFKKEEN